VAVRAAAAVRGRATGAGGLAGRRAVAVEAPAGRGAGALVAVVPALVAVGDGREAARRAGAAAGVAVAAGGPEAAGGRGGRPDRLVHGDRAGRAVHAQHQPGADRGRAARGAAQLHAVPGAAGQLVDHGLGAPAVGAVRVVAHGAVHRDVDGDPAEVLHPGGQVDAGVRVDER